MWRFNIKMTLKDWKKTSNNPLIWSHKKIDDYIIWIRFWNYEYNVNIAPFGFPTPDIKIKGGNKSFKTKSQALKYAKSYMSKY